MVFGQDGATRFRNNMEKEKLNEFLDTKKSKVDLQNTSAEAAEMFIDAMLYAEKYTGENVFESKAYSNILDTKVNNSKEATQHEIDLLSKSLDNLELKAFLENI